MSALVPGQDDLKHRACLGTRYFELKTWFSNVEIDAWEWVKKNFSQNRPKEIFLVTGQTLTTEFSISHFENASAGCEIHVAADVAVPPVVEAGILVGRNFETVTAGVGFQTTVSRGPNFYSIFFEIEKSPPITRLFGLNWKQKSLVRSWFRSILPVAQI